MKYSWKIGSFGKDVDANEAVQELERIEKEAGAITADTILSAAKDPDNVLHNLFEWNDTKAAVEYRKAQARSILNNIEVTIKSDGEPKKIAVYELVIINKQRSYQHVRDFDIQQMNELKLRTIEQIEALRKKLEFYSQFDPVIPKVTELVSMLRAV